MTRSSRHWGGGIAAAKWPLLLASAAALLIGVALLAVLIGVLAG